MIKRLAILIFLMALAIPAVAQLHLDVTLLGKTLDVRDAANKVVASYQISPGVAAHPTPAGSFAVRRIVWNPAWVPPKAKWAKGKKPTAPGDPKNPMKVVKIFFKEPDLYIHGTGDEKMLGDPASHGCIRMAPADAYALARLIMEDGGAAQSDQWYQSVISGGRSVTVRVPKATPVTIAK